MAEQEHTNRGAAGFDVNPLESKLTDVWGDAKRMYEQAIKMQELAAKCLSRASHVWIGAHQPRHFICCKCCGKITTLDLMDAHLEMTLPNEGFGNGGETWTCRECFAGLGGSPGEKQSGENEIGSTSDDRAGNGENRRAEGDESVR